MNELLGWIARYEVHLRNEEKAAATVKKYTRDATAFCHWLADRELKKETVLAYKAELVKKYAPASVNAAVSSLNGFFAYIGRCDLKIKSLKLQQSLFCRRERTYKGGV